MTIHVGVVANDSQQNRQVTMKGVGQRVTVEVTGLVVVGQAEPGLPAHANQRGQPQNQPEINAYLKRHPVRKRAITSVRMRFPVDFQAEGKILKKLGE